MNTQELLLKHFLKSGQVCTDTRHIIPNSIFFALKGDSFDGNQFAHQALEKGSALAVVDDPSVVKGDDYILVEDVLAALQRLATDYRNTFDIPFIGITGSNGKTTTKELLHAALSAHFRCACTAGNFNNHIGVPLTLLSIPIDTEIAIIEMGANHKGEIKELCEIALPTHGLITNVGKAHIEGFGGFEGIKIGKKELYDFIVNHNGTAFINKDNHHLLEMGALINDPIYYSVNSESDYTGQLAQESIFVEFKWKHHSYSSPTVHSQLTGKYNLENMMAAIAVASHFKVPNEKIVSAIEAYSPSNNRSQVQKTKRNTLILDAYNANPTSTKAALHNLSRIDSELNKRFILGDMLELGDEANQLHAEIVMLAEELGLEGIFVGTLFEKANQDKFPNQTTSSSLIESGDLEKYNNCLILIKGSRGIKLETLTEHL